MPRVIVGALLVSQKTRIRPNKIHAESKNDAATTLRPCGIPARRLPWPVARVTAGFGDPGAEDIDVVTVQQPVGRQRHEPACQALGAGQGLIAIDESRIEPRQFVECARVAPHDSKAASLFFVEPCSWMRRKHDRQPKVTCQAIGVRSLDGLKSVAAE